MEPCRTVEIANFCNLIHNNKCMDTNAANYIMISGVSFALGTLTGIFVKERFLKDKEIAQANNFVLVVVTLIWAISMIYDIISPEYTTNPMVHGLMGAIVGFFYKPIKKDEGNAK